MTDWGAVQSNTDTAIQRKLHDLLLDCGWDVEDELVVGRYHVDCYVAELHLGFEADGPQHSAKRDTKRDAWIMEQVALPILRVRYDRLADLHPSTHREIILAWADEWRDSVARRREVYEEAGYL